MASSRPPSQPSEAELPETGPASPSDSTIEALDDIRRRAEFLGVTVDEIVRSQLLGAGGGGRLTNPFGSPPTTLSSPTTDDNDDDDGMDDGVLQVVRSPRSSIVRHTVRATHSLPPDAARQQQQQERLVRAAAAVAGDPNHPPSDDGFASIHSSDIGSYDSADRQGWAADVESYYPDADGRGLNADEPEGEEELDDDDDDMDDSAPEADETDVDPTLEPVNNVYLPRGALIDDIRQAQLRQRKQADAVAAARASTVAAVGGSSSSSTAGPSAADLLLQKEEMERERALMATRQKMYGRRPVASKKGKFWKPAELPAEILSFILDLAYEDLYDFHFSRLPRTVHGRRTTYNFETGQLLAVAAARTQVVQWRLVCKAWRVATDTLGIWRELLELIAGPKNIALRNRIRFASPAFSAVWLTCWACIANGFEPNKAAYRTSTLHGPVFVCGSHSKAGGCCGRCLGDDEQATEYLVLAPVAEPEFYGDQGGASTSCQACRLEILNRCLYVREQPQIDPKDPRPDGGAQAASRYVVDGTIKVLDAVCKVTEARWLASCTPFTLFCEGVRDQRLDDRPAKTKRDKADQRAIALALRGDSELDELGDLLGGVDERDEALEAMHAFEDLTDEDDADEDDDLDSNGRPRLDDEELLQLGRMAIATWTRERILAGYWVSPSEHTLAYHAGLAALAKHRRDPTQHDFDRACYRPLPIRQPLISGDLSAPLGPAFMPHPRYYRTPPPPLPLTADLTAALNEAYAIQLETALRPALDTIVAALARMRDPVAAALSLPLALVFELVQVGFTWESGAADLMGQALSTGERKGRAPVDVLRQFVDAVRPPLPVAPMQPPSDPAVTTSTASATDSPLIGPVQPLTAPRSTRTSVGSAAGAGIVDPSASPDSHALSHSSGPSPALSTPPTSTSPPPHDEQQQKLAETPAAESVPASAPVPVLPTRIQSYDPRPKTQAVPAIPVNLAELGRETVDHLARSWWRAWQPLTSCACPICSRRSNRNDVGVLAAAMAAVHQADAQPDQDAAADMEEDEIREMMAVAAGGGKTLNGGAKRKDEGVPAAEEGDERREASQDEVSPMRAKRARVDAPATEPVDT